ncbi:winged helix DNA-binding domain-containing protein [Kocuria palustris]|uniref:winged helix DNA-binding domain-containing protein n=1 Tax=Kocuria palustris TaxID=71999 RepID=UPI001642E407|nr:winged helix DNA-binding domain-containing protein [Kocuria palustris]
MHLPSFRGVLAHRLIHQALVAPRPDAAAHMLATQDQIYAAGVSALEQRSGLDVLEEIRAQRIVRAWTQRGTVHLTAAEDVRWLTRLCSPRVEAAAAYDRAHDALHERLADGPLTRPQAYDVFRTIGITPENGPGQHLLRSFGGQGDIAQGPRQGSDDTFLLVDDLPVAQRELDGDEALRELAARYLASHGPATVQDLSWWSGLTVRDARRAVELAGDQAVAVTVQDRAEQLFAGPAAEQIDDAQLEAALAVELELPAFDEYLIGYRDRSEFLPAELVPVVGPTKNGMCRPFRVRSGIIAAAE